MSAALAAAILVHVHNYKQHAVASAQHLLTTLATAAARHTDAAGA